MINANVWSHAKKSVLISITSHTSLSPTSVNSPGLADIPSSCGKGITLWECITTLTPAASTSCPIYSSWPILIISFNPKRLQNYSYYTTNTSNESKNTNRETTNKMHTDTSSHWYDINAGLTILWSRFQWSISLCFTICKPPVESKAISIHVVIKMLEVISTKISVLMLLSIPNNQNDQWSFGGLIFIGLGWTLYQKWQFVGWILAQK